MFWFETSFILKGDEVVFSKGKPYMKFSNVPINYSIQDAAQCTETVGGDHKVCVLHFEKMHPLSYQHTAKQYDY